MKKTSNVFSLHQPEETEEQERIRRTEKRVQDLINCIADIDRLGLQVGRQSLAADFMQSLMGVVMLTADRPELLTDGFLFANNSRRT